MTKGTHSDFSQEQASQTPEPCPFRRHLVPQHPLGANHVFKYVFSHMGIHGRQGVVEEVDVGVTVHGPGQAHTLLLAPRQVHTLGRDTAEGWVSRGALRPADREPHSGCSRPRLAALQCYTASSHWSRRQRREIVSA